MALYALADLHFGFAVEKPMDLFGPQWANHSEKIIAHWKEMITEEDMVLLPGDISWGMRLEDAAADLDILAQLPGKKVILEGNHDYWWKSSSQLRYRYPNMIFLKNDTALQPVCGGIKRSGAWSLYGIHDCVRCGAEMEHI